jgi:serine/threonine-protein kinase RsbW
MNDARSLDLPGSEDGVRAARTGFDAFWAAQGLPTEAAWPFQVALDEVLSNIVKHGGRAPEAPARIELTVRRTGDTVEVVVIDDAGPFNPLEAVAPNTTEPLEKRTPGGLGITLVRRLMDVVEYERVAERNRLRMARRLSSSEPNQGEG